MARNEGTLDGAGDPVPLNASAKGDLRSETTEPNLTNGDETVSTISSHDTGPYVERMDDERSVPLAATTPKLGNVDSEILERSDNVDLLVVSSSQSSVEDLLTASGTFEDIASDLGGGEVCERIYDQIQAVENRFPLPEWANTKDQNQGSNESMLPRKAIDRRLRTKSNLKSISGSPLSSAESVEEQAMDDDDDDNDDEQRLRVTCMTQEYYDSDMASIWAGKGKNIYRYTPGSTISYAIVKNFESFLDEYYTSKSIDKAAAAWNNAKVGIKFAQVSTFQDHVFDVAYHKASYKGLCAHAFFPDATDEARVLDVYPSALKSPNREYLPGILTHELGHIIGLRHEFAAASSSEERHLKSVLIGSENSDSIMNYFDHPEKWRLHKLDVRDTGKLYQLSNKTLYKGMKIVDVVPQKRQSCDHPVLIRRAATVLI